MNRLRWRVSGEGEFDLKWLGQWLLRVAIAALVLAVMAAGGKIVINL